MRSDKMQSDVQKRRSARRKKIRRRRLKIALVFFVVIAIFTLAIMVFTVFFPIEHITASGSKLYSNSEIVKATKLTSDDNIFAVSPKKVAKNIRKTLPYVDDIEFERRLPDTVIIKVTDAKEFACYKTGEDYSVVSEKGYVLAIKKNPPKNVFEIVTSGVKCKIGYLAEYEKQHEQELVESLTALLSEKEIDIDLIDVTNSLNITLSVEGKFNVLLGADDNLDKKIAHLASMIDSIGDRKGRIDLSMWTPTNTKGSFVEEKD